jgi:hypothetical protein
MSDSLMRVSVARSSHLDTFGGEFSGTNWIVAELGITATMKATARIEESSRERFGARLPNGTFEASAA